MNMSLKLPGKLFPHRTVILFILAATLSLILLRPCWFKVSELCFTNSLQLQQSGREDRFAYKIPFRVLESQVHPIIKSCPVLGLNHTSNSFYHNEDQESIVSCQPRIPLADSCAIAQELFFSKSPQSCSHQTHHQLCYLDKIHSNHWLVRCNATATQVCASPLALSLGMPDPKIGNLVWKKFYDVDALAKFLTNLLRNPHSIHFGFAFIHCNTTAEFKLPQSTVSYEKNYTLNYYDYDISATEYSVPSSDPSSFVEQILLLPPKSKKSVRRKNVYGKDAEINVNLILIDSTSRQHFFRSMKKTVSAFEAMRDKIDSSTPYVLDFELFQAVKSRTFETLQTLFSGYVNVTETPFSTHAIPEKPLNLSPVFRRFRDRSFRTLWMEDLCYLWEWGISKDLHFLNLERDPSDTWKLMWKKLKMNSVDDVALTLSMCRVLDANNMKDPFRNTNPICFNGKHQHEYLLEYLRLYQQEMSAADQTFFTVTSLNVGHEETGQRIQTLDHHLADYISFLPSLKNTISIIFSDHGNAYGDFFTYSEEARAELFHPFLFLIIPKGVASKLGSSSLLALQKNTKRLVTVLDLHYTLVHLAKISSETISVTNQEFNVSNKGLLDVVDGLRSCDSVPRIEPNLCICNTDDRLVDSSSFHALFGYLAVGIINAEIQKQFLSGFASSDTTRKPMAYGRCKVLQLMAVDNIRENEDAEGMWLISMNIRVQQSQIFFISLKINQQEDGNPIVQLHTLSRTTKYASYEQCADRHVDLSFCVCEIPKASLQKLLISPSKSSDSEPLPSIPSAEHFAKMEPIYTFRLALQHLSEAQNCLIVVTPLHTQGMAIFVANVCSRSFLYNVDISVESTFIYYQPPSDILLLPGSFTFLSLVINPYGDRPPCSIHSSFHEVENVYEYLPSKS